MTRMTSFFNSLTDSFTSLRNNAVMWPAEVGGNGDDALNSDDDAFHDGASDTLVPNTSAVTQPTTPPETF